MESNPQCTRCGTKMPGLENSSLCPVCLLAVGQVQSKTGTASQPPTASPYDPESIQAMREGSYRPQFDPPSLADLNQQIPQLEVLSSLGQGGMGAVYLARQKSLDRLVAIKVIRPDLMDSPESAQRFVREAKALARLNHPNIVSVFDFGEVDVPVPESVGAESLATNSMGRRLFYLVMEYVDGTNLRTALSSQRIKPEEALVIVPQICQALQFAHDQGIIHRDIKPENILLDKSGRVKIADFGLAKLVKNDLSEPGLTDTNQLMGTPRYMAPEQFQQSRTIDHRADIYSLGVVFYELLTGELPVGVFEPPSDRVQIDVRLDEVVLRALAKSPDRRYQQASEIKVDVEKISRAESPAKLEPTRANPSRTEVVLPGRHFPRDLRDLTRGLVASLLLLLIWYLIPTTLLISLLNLVVLSWPTVMSVIVGVSLITIVILISFVAMALRSVKNVGFDFHGISFHRYLGPADRVPWSEIVNIRSLTFWELVTEFLVWPGFPPRGSIFTQSVSGYYRLRTQGGSYYYCPHDVDRWVSTIERMGHSDLISETGLAARSVTTSSFLPIAALVALVSLTALIGHAFIWRLKKPNDTSVSAPIPSQPGAPQILPPDVSWVRTANGPRLSDSFARWPLRIDDDQLEQISQILTRAEQRFLSVEKQGITREVQPDGRISVTIPSQIDEITQIQNELWTDLDRVLNVEQQKIARLNLGLEPAPVRNGAAVKELVAPGFFGWSENGAKIELWRVGSWHHWRISTRGFELEDQAPELPFELQRFQESE